MGFLNGLFGAAGKIITLPFVVLNDVSDIAEGETPHNTGNQLGGAIEDVGRAVRDLFDGDLIDDFYD